MILEVAFEVALENNFLTPSYPCYFRAAQQGVLKEQLSEANSEMEALSANHVKELVRIEIL